MSHGHIVKKKTKNKREVTLVRRLDSLMDAVCHILFIKYRSKSEVCRETENINNNIH